MGHSSLGHGALELAAPREECYSNDSRIEKVTPEWFQGA